MMKTFLLLILLIAVAVVVYFFMLGSKSKQGVATGLVNNQLSQCGSKPNCVCSEQQEQGEHYIAPFQLAQGSNLSLDQVAEVVKAAGGRVEQAADNYLAATFTSGLFGYVDDVEVRIEPEQGLVHLRSASRVGHSDFGANRKRVDKIKTALQAG